MKPSVVIAIPARDEEAAIRASVAELRAFADRELGAYDVTVLIADNGSTDATASIGRELAASMPGVAYLRVEERGKGNAIARAWQSRSADIYAFMDADLSTGLAALPELLRRVRDGAGLAVGSRFHAGSRVERSPLRRALSSAYRLVMRSALGVRTSDAPCGFKSASAQVVRELVPQVRNRAWFFDSELVVRAERGGFRVEEVPVTWRERHHEGRRSQVDVVRVAAEYLREVWRLRRELRAARAGASEAAQRADRRIVFRAAAALALLTSIAPAVGWYVARAHGLEWNGRQSFAPGDLAAYLSSINQAAHGAVFLANAAGAEGSVAVLNPVWSLAGIIARIPGCSPLGAFHALRILLIPALAAAAYAALKHFVPERRARLAAFFLLLFGSGAGTYAALALKPYVPRVGAYEWPTDLWVAESNLFSSASYSPHFVASWTLLLLALFLLSRAYARSSMRDAALAGACALALATFHPFHAVTLCAVGAAWLALWIRRRGMSFRDLAVYVIFVALPAPALTYFWWLTYRTPDGSFMRDANLLWTPSVPQVLIGLAGFLLLAPIGFLAARKRGGETSRRATELALWAVVQCALIYLPFFFQRRLMEGLEFPLAALSGLGALALYERVSMMRPGWRAFVAPVLLVVSAAPLFLTTSFLVIVRDARHYLSLDAPFFFTRDEADMLAWLRRAPRGTALGAVDTGNDVLGWGGQPVYAGHWALTTDLARKKSEIAAFYGPMSSADRLAFLSAHGIVYVIEGPREKALGAALLKDATFSQDFTSGSYAVYSPRR